MGIITEQRIIVVVMSPPTVAPTIRWVDHPTDRRLLLHGRVRPVKHGRLHLYCRIAITHMFADFIADSGGIAVALAAAHPEHSIQPSLTPLGMDKSLNNSRLLGRTGVPSDTTLTSTLLPTGTTRCSALATHYCPTHFFLRSDLQQAGLEQSGRKKLSIVAN